jgi:hypothetical protein
MKFSEMYMRKNTLDCDRRWCFHLVFFLISLIFGYVCVQISGAQKLLHMYVYLLCMWHG